MPRSLHSSAYWTYALAFLGAHLAFMPLFVLLLPRRVEMLAPEDTAVWLSWLLLTGGIIAGLANVAAGAVGDRWLARFGSRHGLIFLGWGLLLLSYAGFALADDLISLFAALIFFQLALNCCFSPLGALLADHFPDEVKGRLGGLMTAALPASSLLVLPIAWLFPDDNALAFLLTGTVAAACMLPLLLFWRLGPVIGANNPAMAVMAAPSQSPAMRDEPPSPSLLRDFSFAWLSRLLIQTGAAFVIGYVYLYISAMQLSQQNWRGADASEILAAITAPSAILAIIVTLLCGLFSDRANNRRLPLFTFACLFGGGLGLLAITTDLIWFLVGYSLLQTALAAYLGVDTALIAQLVSGHSRRGLLLGIMNLSNTLPSIIVPALALSAFTESQVSGMLTTMFGAFAFIAIFAGGLVLLIRGVR